VAVAFTVTRTTEAYLVERVDAQLQSDRFPGRQLGRGEGRGRGHGPDMAPSSAYVGFVDDVGVLQTVVTPNLTGNELPPPDLPDDLIDPAGMGPSKPLTVGTDPPSGTRYRVVVEREAPDGALRVVALPLDDVDSLMSRLITVELLASALILILLALLGFWMVKLGLTPLKQMTRTATAIAGGDLSSRVPPVAPGTEAGELGTALNRMLGRIEEAFDERTRSEARLRQFVSDASHELRTPVTTIRGYAELYRAGGLDDPEQLDQAMRRTEDEAIRLGTMVDDLLLLARLDQGRPLDQAPVDLAVIVRDAAADARAVAPDRDVTTAVEGPVVVLGDEGRLRQVVANLVGNALVHTPAGTAVDLTAAVHADGRAVLAVHDHGPGIPAEVAERVFERFYRQDPARSRHHGGSGLGLAITQAIVNAHGGEIRLDPRPGGGSTFEVSLPAAPPR
jgi:two-component system OmpR family sensor kinase